MLAIALVSKKLLTKYHDETMCTQYAWWLIESIARKQELNTVEQMRFLGASRIKKNLMMRLVDSLIKICRLLIFRLYAILRA